MEKYMDKFELTREENLFLVKRNVIDYIWKSANLEGVKCTFPETQAIYNNINVANLSITDIMIINNLKHAWEFLINSVDDELDFNYLASINALIGSNLITGAGRIRNYDVAIAGTNWKPSIDISAEDFKKLKNEFDNYDNKKSITEKSIILMCKLMKMQLFNDGNKRTALLAANHEMIKNGKGIISISHFDKVEFGEKLIQYYETDDMESLKKFIYDKCVIGMTKIEEK